SMVEYTDGSMLAQISEPSMILPIQYALTYPRRLPGIIKPYDFAKFHTLQFFPPDLTKFLCLALAYEALRQGGSMACYMNAANEVLVDRFVQGQIGWLEIGKRLEKLMSRHSVSSVTHLDHILSVEREAREQAQLL